MELPHCYKDKKAVEPFFDKAKQSVPFLAYLAIKDAYVEQDKMFKTVALTHLKKYFKKSAIKENDFRVLINLLDTFQDPYEEFIAKRSSRTWNEIKNNILGGINS